MSTVFISYNRKSNEITQRIGEDIKELGHAVWFDREISGGQLWWDTILSAIRNCDVLVVILEQNSLNSIACQREYTYAFNLGKPILPVLVSDKVQPGLLPPELSAIQFVDCINYDTKAVLRLARALGNMPSAKPLPSPLPASPEIPVSYLGGISKRIKALDLMTFEDQKSVLMDLKNSCHDKENHDEAKNLLEELRKRKDLLAIVAGEIDELLRIPNKADPTKPVKEIKIQAGKIEHPKPKPPKKKIPDPNSLSEQLKSTKGGIGNTIIGSWNVQNGLVSAKFIFNPNGTFSGQIFLPTGINTPVQGNWMVQAMILSLRGTQTLMFVNYPYTIDIMVMDINQNRVEGLSGGELVVMTRG